eukprot:CAMPEP_0172179532 /NCGR_PEP_ID=MMETSP1050-20130122/16675_1 /TAXON_ID=233186 /ORGANISM="Cryptomonas curvata, Strain CCAP979/52" /LENGTH=182 /DNA_ID=CAMNT_0012852435 /DNA_START=156 /DNA_END=704 /DNA_ORIENTATION=+
MEVQSEDGGLDAPSPMEKFYHKLSMKYTAWKDATAPHTVPRWGSTAVCFLIYCIRVYNISGWYIVSYGLGIYMLNLGIGFLSPAADPAVEGILPTSESDEFRPFVRKLPEFKFWYSMTQGIVIAFGMTFFSLFNVPVFWPILVFYFFALFFMTMRRQIQHMIKHKYIPMTLGKPKFKGKDTE